MRNSAQADTAKEDINYARTSIRRTVLNSLHRRSVCDKYQVDICRKMCFHLPTMVVSPINSLFCLHFTMNEHTAIRQESLFREGLSRTTPKLRYSNYTRNNLHNTFNNCSSACKLFSRTSFAIRPCEFMKKSIFKVDVNTYECCAA